MKAMKLTMVCVLVAMLAQLGSAQLLGPYGGVGYTNSVGVGYFRGSDGTQYGYGPLTQFAYGGNMGVVAGDISGNGTIEFIRGGGTGNNAWYEAKGAPDYGWLWKANAPAGGSVSNGFSIFDYGNDGINDIFRISSAGQLSWYKSTGTPGGVSWIANIGDNFTAVAGGKFGAGSGNDLFAIRSNQIVWYQGTGPATHTWITNISISGVQDMVIGDFDGDGVSDMFYVGSDGQVYWYKSTGQNTFPTALVASFGTGARSLALGDVNGDGINQLFVGHSGNKSIWAYQATGVGMIDSGHDLLFGTDAASLTAYVPEPATIGLLGLGAWFSIRRKRK